MAVVFQEYGRSLFPWLSVRDNVELPLQARRSCPSAQRARAGRRGAGRGRAAPTPTTAYPWQLSGGMQQRVAIARAVAYQPQVLLMDEPFAAVDAQTRADLEDLIRALWQRLGVTLLFVTHDIDEAVYLGQRVIVLSASPTGRRRSSSPIDLPDERDQLHHPRRPAVHRAARARLRADPGGQARRAELGGDCDGSHDGH